MGLTITTGPLSRRAPATRNFTVEGPAHSLLLEPFGRRVRAEIDGVTVLDSERGALLHETGLLPQLYVPTEDVAAGPGVEAVPTDTSTHCPFKGDAAYHSLRVGERTVTDAVWSYPEPLPGAEWLAGLSAVPFSAADRWFDEDDEAVGHLTDPYHRVDVRRTSRHVVVTLGGEAVADAAGAALVAETGLENRFYLDRAAVRARLEPSGTRTVCPYKGWATYYDVHVGDRVLADAAWSYEEPLAPARELTGLVSLAHDDLTVTAERA